MVDIGHLYRRQYSILSRVSYALFLVADAGAFYAIQCVKRDVSSDVFSARRRCRERAYDKADRRDAAPPLPTAASFRHY